MTTLEILTVEKIRAWRPCRDPVKYVSEDWTGTIIDILEMSIRHEHKLWCIDKSKILSIRAWQEFAIFCGYQALSYIENPDPHSITALKEAELYLNGKITREEIQIIINRVFETAYAAADPTTYYAIAAAYYTACNAATNTDRDSAYYANLAADYAVSTAYYAIKCNGARTTNNSRCKQIAKLKELILETIK